MKWFLWTYSPHICAVIILFVLVRSSGPPMCSFLPLIGLYALSCGFILYRLEHGPEWEERLAFPHILLMTTECFTMAGYAVMEKNSIILDDTQATWVVVIYLLIVGVCALLESKVDSKGHICYPRPK